MTPGCPQVQLLQRLPFVRSLLAIALAVAASACGSRTELDLTSTTLDAGSPQPAPTSARASATEIVETTGTTTATDTDVHSIMTPYVDSGSDTGCITTAVPGAPCTQGQHVCTLNLPCQPIWSCDPTSHWQEAVPACGGSPGSPDDAVPEE